MIQKHTIIQQNLAAIAQLAIEREAENNDFKSFLQTFVPEDIDNIVHGLNEAIAPQIDCTACGNCCKSLMINVTDAEADNLSHYLNQPREDFDTQYLEKGSSMMVMNTIPCSFLSNNKCTVYEHRFAGCREFPAMHLPHFTKRLFNTFMHYPRCPIIFNVVEGLKESLGFNG